MFSRFLGVIRIRGEFLRRHGRKPSDEEVRGYNYWGYAIVPVFLLSPR